MRNALPLALILLAPTAALAAPKKAGPLVYHNNTASRIRVTATELVTAEGARSSKNAAWDLAPGARSALWMDGKPVVCHRFVYRLTTAEGTSSWTGTCHVLNTRGEFVLELDAGLLAQHRKSATGEKLKRATARVFVRNAAGQKATVVCRYYLDADGKTRYVKGGSWTLPGNSNGYLNDLGKPLPVSRFEFTLHTADGKTDWSLVAPESGDIVFVIDAAFLNRHRVALGLKPAAPAAGAVSEAARQRATVKIITAVLAHAAATSKRPKDLAEALVQQLALKTRDALIEGALKDVFPTRSGREIAAVRRVIALALEGKLNLNRFRAETAKEELIEALKKADAGAGAAAEVADFIYGVHKALKK